MGVDGIFLLINTFMMGFIISTCSTVPALIDITFGLALFLPNNKEPHLGQNNFVIVLPLSAVWVKDETLPLISTLFSGTNRFVPKTEPVARRQSLQWQLNIALGSE